MINGNILKVLLRLEYGQWSATFSLFLSLQQFEIDNCSFNFADDWFWNWIFNLPSVES